jgi:pimeloyl-ACP methyl ester carboxylesterase
MSLANLMKSHRWKVTAFGILAIVFVVRYWPGEPSSELSEIGVEKHRASRQLVVMVHGGLGRGKQPLHDLIELVNQELPNADLLVPAYPGGRFVNTNSYALASKLEALIDRTFEDGRYERIILIGYSAGGLLLRKAYVYGLGSTEDRRSYPRTSRQHRWTKHVERIVLAAGMNRGWSVDPPPEDMRWPSELEFRIGKLIGRAFRIGQFILGLERGAPFVADLRVQWVRLAHTDGVRLAPAIQLLGDNDDLVSSADNKDLSTVTSNFIFIPLHDTDHANVMDFQELRHGAERRQGFVEALTYNIEGLQQKYGAVGTKCKLSDKCDSKIKHIVFLMHGIRDPGQWTTVLANRIGDNHTLAITSKYGYFPMGPFLLLEDRQKNVRWFMDQYTEAVAEHPAVLKEGGGVSFIGHSNGTYLLASALQHYHTLEVDRVAFAGSVVPRKYPWNELKRKGRVKVIRNDIGDKDWVVAIFPGFFEQFNRVTGIGLFDDGDIGTGGFYGFEEYEGNKNERYYDGSHGVTIEESNFESLANFIRDGKIERPGSPPPPLSKESKPNSKVSWLNKVAWLVFVLIIVALYMIGLVAVKQARPQWRPFGWMLYLTILVVLLYTA